MAKLNTLSLGEVAISCQFSASVGVGAIELVPHAGEAKSNQFTTMGSIVNLRSRTDD